MASIRECVENTGKQFCGKMFFPLDFLPGRYFLKKIFIASTGILGGILKNKTGITVNVVSTDGSKANIQGIDAGNYQLGTVQSDVMSYAWDGTRAFQEEGKIDTFRTVAGLYAEAVQLVTMNPEIKSVADLADVLFNR